MRRSAHLMKPDTKLFDLLDKVYAETGRIPTIRKIREMLGGGSMTTLSKSIKNWKVSKGLNDMESSELPKDLSEALAGQVSLGIWAAIRPYLHRKLDMQKTQFLREIALLTDTQESLQKQLAETQTLLRKADQRIKDLTEANKQLKSELDQARLAVARAEGALNAISSMSDK